MTHQKIILEGLSSQLRPFAEKYFDYIVGLPTDARPADEKPRTGIQILLEEADTRNLTNFPVYSPSEAAVRFASKKVDFAQSHKHFSSQNSADPKKMRFAGCVAIEINGQIIYASTSGLKAEEDVAISIMMLHHLTGLSTAQICENIVYHGGLLPDCFKDKKHYLHKFLFVEKH